jgi:hypothetical protein
MATLGNQLSNEAKTAIVTSALEQGDVFLMNLSPKEGVTPKKNEHSRDKYFVVLGVDENKLVGALLINSAINPNIPQELKDLHYPLYAKDYRFLKHNSFVNCGNLIEINNERFTSQFHSPKGKMNSRDIKLIINTLVNDSPVNPKKLKQFHII